MKEKLQCDNCGGNLTQSENGIFVCEHCGTGYKISNDSKPIPYRNPHVENTIIINNVNPNKISSLSSDFRSFCNRY